MFGAVYAFGVAPRGGRQPAERANRLAQRLFVTPVVMIVVVLITLRLCPGYAAFTPPDRYPRLLLVAAALIGPTTYGNHPTAEQGSTSGGSADPGRNRRGHRVRVVGTARCDEPALDMRARSLLQRRGQRGAANNLVQGGSMIMVTYCLVVIRGLSTVSFAASHSGHSALGAGRRRCRAGRDSVGNATVVVAGLAVLAVSLLVRLSFKPTPRSLLSRLS